MHPVSGFPNRPLQSAHRFVANLSQPRRGNLSTNPKYCLVRALTPLDIDNKRPVDLGFRHNARLWGGVKAAHRLHARAQDRSRVKK